MSVGRLSHQEPGRARGACGIDVNDGECPDHRAEQNPTTRGEQFRCGEGLMEGLRDAACFQTFIERYPTQC